MNNPYKVLLVVGKAGSGKDTLVEELVKDQPTLFNKIITCTTRPRRNNEIEDIHYHFYTEEKFKHINFIEQTEFNGWHYGTTYEDFSPFQVNILVVNPQGVQTYLSNKNFQIVGIIYLVAEDSIRLIRQLKREEKPDCSEICRRFFADEKDFTTFRTKLLYVNVHQHFPAKLMYNNDKDDLEYNKNALIYLAKETLGKNN